MSPEQLKQLRYLSQLFEEGQAGPDQIKQLSELLASINHHVDLATEEESNLLKQVTAPL
jgi:hypothetical protein